MIQKIKNGKKVECKSNKGGIKKAGDHWVNEGVKIIDKIECFIPTFIINVLRSLTREFPHDEFSIFLKFSYNEDKRRIDVGSEYYIPLQTVSGASVDYEEGPPEGFNGIAHKHPNGCRHFSGTDDTYINQNYDLSILWEGNELREGQLRVNTPYGRIKLALEFVTEVENLPTIAKEDLAKIKKRQVYSYNYRGGHQQGYGRRSYFGKKSNTSLKGAVVPQVGLLSHELEAVNEQLNADLSQGESKWDKYIEEVLAICEAQGVDWNAAESIWRENKNKETKEPSNVEEIQAKFSQNSKTSLPGAVRPPHICSGGVKIIKNNEQDKQE